MKRFVEEFVSVGDEAILSTTKPDTYARSLADGFVRAGKPRVKRLERRDGASDAEAEVFLNHARLENDHAARYDGGSKDE